jgi:hypothetical protein
MSVAVVRNLVFSWHFQCPECGMGDEELGQLAHADEIYCEVCIAESDVYVRLHRWPAERVQSKGGGSSTAVRARAASPEP